ncbi:MAG: hypothetical protein V1836_01695 [Candidatus Aenigmatarchaeota archaeon]
MENSGKDDAVSFDNIPTGLYYKKGGKWVTPPEGKLTKIPDDENGDLRRIRTKNYDIIFKQLQSGGPSGYESRYLTEEGEPAATGLYEELEKFDSGLPIVSQRAIRQRNGAGLVDALNNEKTMGIASGFKPSGAVHFGHKLTASTIVYFQRNGAQVFIPVADVEAGTEKKLMESDPSLSRRKRYEYWAADNLLDWGANGINLDAAHVYLQSEEKRASEMAAGLIATINFDFAIDTYKFEKLAENFPFLFAGASQAADIILPQHPDFANYHSFMVSGPDQDGHMTMTLEMIKNSLSSVNPVAGLQTVPSAFYIPHMRGLTGNKASSSQPDSTLFVGAGPQKLSLADRLKTETEKLSYSIANTTEATEFCALDMVRYLREFNRYNKINFREICENPPASVNDSLKAAKTPEERSRIMSHYLVGECEKNGQYNCDIVQQHLKDELLSHYDRRTEVYEYALARAQGRKTSQPSFWTPLPSRAIVDESKRNRTKWYDIVNELKNDLMV